MLQLERYRKGKGTFHNSFAGEKVQIFLLGSPSVKTNKKLAFKSKQFFIDDSTFIVDSKDNKKHRKQK